MYSFFFPFNCALALLVIMNSFHKKNFEQTGLFCRKNLKKDMMLYVSFCKQIESDWMSVKQISEVCFNRYACFA